MFTRLLACALLIKHRLLMMFTPNRIHWKYPLLSSFGNITDIFRPDFRHDLAIMMLKDDRSRFVSISPFDAITWKFQTKVHYNAGNKVSLKYSTSRDLATILFYQFVNWYKLVCIIVYHKCLATMVRKVSDVFVCIERRLELRSLWCIYSKHFWICVSQWSR